MPFYILATHFSHVKFKVKLFNKLARQNSSKSFEREESPFSSNKSQDNGMEWKCQKCTLEHLADLQGWVVENLSANCELDIHSFILYQLIEARQGSNIPLCNN